MLSSERRSKLVLCFTSLHFSHAATPAVKEACIRPPVYHMMRTTSLSFFPLLAHSQLEPNALPFERPSPDRRRRRETSHRLLGESWFSAILQLSLYIYFAIETRKPVLARSMTSSVTSQSTAVSYISAWTENLHIA